MAGLDSIKHFADGGEVDTSQGAINATMDKSGKTSVAGKIALDPTQTEAILTNMQQYIDERQSPMNLLMGGINRAYATTYGPSALTAHDQQKNLEDKQIMDYRTQMAAYRAAQAQAGNEAARYQSMTPTAGGAAPTGGAQTVAGGVPVSAEQLAIENSLGTAAEKLDSRRKYLAGRNTEATKKEFAPAMANIVDIYVPGEGMKQMTQAQAEKMLNGNPNLQAVVGGQKVPAAQVISQAPAAPATTPTGTPGQAVKIATDLNIPIISGDRDWDKQYDLYLKSKQPGYTGNPVAYPGTSKHQTGNAIDVGPINAQQRQALTDAGFKQTVPNDKNHWELTSAPATTARPAPTTVAAQPAQNPNETRQQYEQRIAEQKDIVASRVKESEIKRGEILQARESSIETGNAIGRIENLLNTPEGVKAVGVFNKPGVVSAFGQILSEGIQAGNFGSVKFTGLENAVRAAGGDQKTIDAAQSLARDFAQMQLNIAKRDLKGQGAVSDNERAIVAKVTGSTANSPEVLKDFTRWNRVRNTFDKQVGDALQNWEEKNPNQSYTKFKQSAEYKALENDYIAKTDAMAAKMNLGGKKAAPSESGKKAEDLLKQYATKKES